MDMCRRTGRKAADASRGRALDLLLRRGDRDRGYGATRVDGTHGARRQLKDSGLPICRAFPGVTDAVEKVFLHW